MAIFERRKKNVEEKLIPASLNPICRNQLIDLALFYGLKQTPTLVKLCEELVESTDLQKQFRIYCQTAERLPADRKSASHTSITTSFKIPVILLERIHRLRSEMRILELSFFIRVIITFFFDTRIAIRNNDQIERLRKFLEKKYTIDYIGFFDGKLIFHGEEKSTKP